MCRWVRPGLLWKYLFVQLGVGAYESKDYDSITLNRVQNSHISSYINTSITQVLTFKCMIAKPDIKWICFKYFNSCLERSF